MSTNLVSFHSSSNYSDEIFNKRDWSLWVHGGKVNPLSLIYPAAPTSSERSPCPHPPFKPSFSMSTAPWPTPKARTGQLSTMLLPNWAWTGNGTRRCTSNFSTSRAARSASVITGCRRTPTSGLWTARRCRTPSTRYTSSRRPPTSRPCRTAP